ncbi:MAG TPA: tetratricopeptide repeat protein, partial [Geobacteraceae bacterium]
MILAGAAAILLVAFAAYHNSFGGPFVFDDRPCVVENATIRELWPPRLLMPPENRGDTVDGRPLVNFTLAVNYALGGLNVRGYHIFNLAVHIAAALTLFGLLRRTFRSPRMEEHFRQAALPLALAAALLWVAHPLQTSAVTYVIQRAESLVSLFYLLTLYCLARSGDSPRPALWQACGVAACLLGALTKEVIVTAPVAALL